ncbi:MAG: MATE family efflux transporter [Calditrichia bacterium]
MKKNQNLLEGPISKPLISLSVPMIIAFGFQTSFNFVDRFFVSRLGDVSTAAIGMAFIVQLVIIAIGSGMGMGLNSYISRTLGAGQKEKAVSAALHSFLLALVVGLLIWWIGSATQHTLFRALGAKGALLQQVTAYLSILFPFAPVYLLTMICNNIFRGWGDTVYPMKFMVSATLANIILDPIFIFGLGPVTSMGIKGAALATGISRVLSLIYLMYVILGKGLPVKLKWQWFKWDLNIIKGIFQVGLPASAGQVLTSVSISIMFLIIKKYGDDARAAYTIAFTYEMVAFLPVLGIGQAVTILTGHNYGAKKYQRIKKVYFTALKYAIAMTIPATISVSIAPHWFAEVFARTPEVADITARALRILSPAYALAGIYICTVSSFQGLGLGSYQLYATLIRMFVLITPLAWLGTFLFGLDGVWGGIVLANAIIDAILLIWYHQLYYKRLVTGRIQTLR